MLKLPIEKSKGPWKKGKKQEQKENSFIKMFRKDYKDTVKAANYIRNGEFANARRSIWHMDTAAREEIHISAYNIINKYFDGQKDVALNSVKNKEIANTMIKTGKRLLNRQLKIYDNDNY